MTPPMTGTPPSDGAAFVRRWQEDAARLAAQHAYDPAEEHDACGCEIDSPPDEFA